MMNLVKNKIIYKILSFIGLMLIVFSTSSTPSHASTATLYLATTQGTVLLNSIVSIDLFVSSPQQSVNTYDVTVNFDNNFVRPLFINKAGSLCTIYVRELAIGETNARITCGQPTPGFQGNLGKIAMISFQTLREGTTGITISPSSQVLANDGNGTNILGSTRGVTLNIVRGAGAFETPIVRTEQGYQSGDWINQNSVTFLWDTVPNAKGYSYSFSTNPDEAPNYTIDTTDLSVGYTDLPDGTYYFKIFATDGFGTSGIQTFIIQIDTTGPRDLSINLNTCNPVTPAGIDTQQRDTEDCKTYTDQDENIVLDTTPIIDISAVDDGSGISHYAFSLNGGEFITTRFQYPLDSIMTGRHTLVYRAYDNAGNYTERTLTFSTIEVKTPDVTLIKTEATFTYGENVYINGKADPNVIIMIYINGELIGTTFTDKDGNYSYVITRQLDIGNHEITVQAMTSGGVLSEMSEKMLIEIIEDKLVTVANLEPIIVRYSPLCIIPIIILFIMILLKRRKKKEEEELKDSLNDTKEELQRDLELIEKAARYGLDRKEIAEGMAELEQKYGMKLDPDEILKKK